MDQFYRANKQINKITNIIIMMPNPNFSCASFFYCRIIEEGTAKMPRMCAEVQIYGASASRLIAMERAIGAFHILRRKICNSLL
jgi:hypothetical protein